MKKIKFFFPAIAMGLAVAGVFVPKYPRAAVLDVAVTASPIFCALDGFCDQSNASTCKLSGTGIVFFRTQGIICATAATGRFHQ